MGIPEADRPFIRQWTTKMLFAGRSKEADRMQYVAQGLQKFYAYLPSLIEERMISPKEDLLSVSRSAKACEVSVCETFVDFGLTW